MSVDLADLLLRMEDHDIIPSCLSAERHKPRDFLLHYFGCEQFFQREDYFASLNDEQQRQVQAKLVRIQILRSALHGDLVDGRPLVLQLAYSLSKWRASKEFLEGITRVRELRTTHFAQNGVAQREVGIPPRAGEYNADVDTHAYLIRFKNGRPVHDLADPRFRTQFPSHRISVHDLIHERGEHSALLPAKNTINYFHFPANNMLWAERAISNYLKIKPVPPTPRLHGNSPTVSHDEMVPVAASQTRSIVGPKYWKGQQQSSAVTGKYLRPMCELVSVSAGPDENAEGTALFMPYLHWDTARHQAIMSQAVHKETERQRKERLQQERQLAGMRRVRHRGLQLLNANSRQANTAWRLENRSGTHAQAHALAAAAAAVAAPPPPPPPLLLPPPQRSATSAFAGIMKRHGRLGKLPPPWAAFAVDAAGRVAAGTALGQVLFDAAMLHEALATLRERRLVRAYLHADPPLHPRRTLEQTNEWTLSLSWHASARDQVVHRATRPKPLDFRAAGAAAHPLLAEWNDGIRKVPRVMMIDQLWMWILDDQTLITCCPDHGDLTDHHSMPGIHKAIRESLMNIPRGQMKTVFDVALLVLSEVQISRAALQGVKPQDGQIGLMALFRQAIRDVASKHSFGAEQYWEWARIFSRLAHTDVDNGLSDLIVPFLDIGKEGELQGQCKSIKRDLEIMHRITVEQREVVEKFAKAVQHLARGRFSPDVEPLLREIHSNVEAIEDMRRSADDISGSLDYLISLKQQQVTVVQAWQSMRQGEDNQRQNITLLVFTVVTVVFARSPALPAAAPVHANSVAFLQLPMSFVSSVFGMNNKEITGPGAPMTLAEQFKWMIPLSFAIVAITYYTAFGSPRRMCRDLFRWLYIRAGMYRLFAPGDLTLAGLRDRVWGRRLKKEADRAWVRRRSEQMARDAQDRRQATRRAAVFAHAQDASVSPETPVATPAPAAWPPPRHRQAARTGQTGMFAVYETLNANRTSRRGADMV